MSIIVISLLMTSGTRPSGAGATVQKHHSHGLDQLHPQLPQGKWACVCASMRVRDNVYNCHSAFVLLTLECSHRNNCYAFKCSNSCWSCWLNMSLDSIKMCFIRQNIPALSYLIWCLAQLHYLLSWFYFYGYIQCLNAQVKPAFSQICMFLNGNITSLCMCWTCFMTLGHFKPKVYNFSEWTKGAYFLLMFCLYMRFFSPDRSNVIYRNRRHKQAECINDYFTGFCLCMCVCLSVRVCAFL